MRVIHAQSAPSNPQKRGKAMAAASGAAISILAIGLIVWMALDVDRDGQSTYSELQGGTSPTNGDTDGDGIADGWEVEHGYDALSAASAPELPEASSPDAPSAQELEECSIGDITLGLSCGDEGDGTRTDDGAPGTQAEVPPAGGNGTAGTLVIGGATTLVAGVAARLISSAILHRT